MLDHGKQAEADQAIAVVSELCPAMWWQLYQGCVKEGFSAEQALELVQTYIWSTSPNR